MTFPSPAPCHPERCLAMSADVQIVSENAHDTLIVECDDCATVVATHKPEHKVAAVISALLHITTHHHVTDQ